MHREVKELRATARPFGVLLICGSTLIGCGGRAGRVDGPAAAGVAGEETAAGGNSAGAGTSPSTGGIAGSSVLGTAGVSAGAGGSSAGTGGFAGAPSVVIDRAICARFLPRWESLASATTSDCNSCVMYGSCNWPSTDPCIPGTDCVERHCTTAADAETLCSCIESCFSVELRACDALWSNLMDCSADACAGACP